MLRVGSGRAGPGGGRHLGAGPAGRAGLEGRGGGGGAVPLRGGATRNPFPRGGSQAGRGCAAGVAAKAFRAGRPLPGGSRGAME